MTLTLVVTTIAATPYTAGMPMFVLVLGIVPFLLGYVATAPPAKGEASSSEDVNWPVPRRTAIGVVLGMGGCLFAILLYVSLTLTQTS